MNTDNSIDISLDNIASDVAEAATTYIGFSGGSDSSILSYLASKRWGDKVCLVHVNYGISEDADTWQQHCQAQAELWDVRFIAKRISTPLKDEKSLRDIRYCYWQELLESQDILLLAHHAQDQLETVLFRLFRGHNLLSLQGMPARRSLGKGLLMRPFLELDTDCLHQALEEHNIPYIEDISNQDTSIDRNYIRHNVVPQIRQRWPQVCTGLNRLIQQIQEIPEPAIIWHDTYRGFYTDITPLLALPVSQRRHAIERQLKVMGAYWGYKQAEELDRLFSARQDSTPLLQISDLSLRAWRDRMYIYKPHKVTKSQSIAWDGCTPAAIEGLGELTSTANLSGMRIVLPQGGERFCASDKDCHHSIKEMMRIAQIAPWLRSITPLVYLEDKLIYIAGVRAVDEYKTQFSWKWQAYPQ